MKNHYQIIDYSELGLPSIEVFGDAFHYQDLYEIVGRDQYMTTFTLRSGSESYSKYGESVLGVIFYDHKKLNDIYKALENSTEINQSIIKIDSFERDLTVEKKKHLKYKIGINIFDIKSISFFPHKREVELHETGEKKIPNIVNVEVDFDNFDIDILCQNYLVSKLNSNVELILFEKEQLIGITLGINNGRIDSKILAHLGFNEEDLKTNLNIWFHLYKLKERRGQLTETDKTNFVEVNDILTTKKLIKLYQEINASGLRKNNIEDNKEAFSNICQTVEDFNPSILLHEKKQVYWDVESYIHITLRHIKNYQIGDFKQKTPLPYKATDLKSLIEKVLTCVEDELKHHLSENTGKNFKRHGSMGIMFNGDHYNLDIEPNGRLVQFHTVSQKT